jgi:type IV pilus assembly protein PilC
MPTTYVYRVKDRSGRTIEGQLEADNPTLVAQRLRQMGYVPVAISPRSVGVRREITIPWLGSRVHPRDMALMARQFATLVDSGLTLLRALSVLADQTSSKPLRRVLNEVRLDIEKGSSLSYALARHPKVFSRLFVAMVRAGEAGGVLDNTLRQVATMTEKQVELRRKIWSALTYPSVVVVLVLLILSAMLIFVVPQFKSIYASLNSKLPAPTRALISVSDFAAHAAPFILVALVAAVFAARRFVRTPTGKAAWDRFVLAVPVLGRLAHKTALARFSRTLAALLRAGVPILESLEITKETVGRTQFSRAIDEMQRGVRQGESMTRRLSAHPIFPPMVGQMLAVGEETGAVDAMLDKVGDFYEQEVDTMVASLTSLLEPILIMILGGAVGSMVITLYLPMFDIIKTLNAQGG